MKESDLTKLARWIVPGWVAILSFFAFIVLDYLFTLPGKGSAIQPLMAFMKQTSEVSALIISFIIAASGIPLGFVIYQTYFFLRWNSPFSRDGLVPPLLTGRMNDLNRTLEDLGPNEISKTIEWREKWIFHPLFERDHGFKWRYIELLFSESAQIIDSKYQAVSVYSRHQYLHEITHTLGASVTAVYVGFLSYFFVKFIKQGIPLASNLVITSILVGILFYLLNKEDQSTRLSNIIGTEDFRTIMNNDPIAAFEYEGRIFPLKKSVKVSVLQPGAMFIFGLGLVHLFSNPILNPVVQGSNFFFDLFLRILLSVAAIWVWTISKKSTSSSFVKGDVLYLSLLLLSAIIIKLIPIELMSWVEWPLFVSIYIFVIANMILFKNRQNAVNDMLALENYTLKRYLFEFQDLSKDLKEQ